MTSIIWKELWRFKVTESIGFVEQKYKLDLKRDEIEIVEFLICF